MQRPQGVCSDGFIGSERTVTVTQMERVTGSGRQNSSLLTDKSADQTNKSIKQKPTEIGPFTKHFSISLIKNVLFLFRLHSLVWI
jgi:hypothetical protein